jgi:hypothetical protein
MSPSKWIGSIYYIEKWAKEKNMDSSSKGNINESYEKILNLIIRGMKF